MCLLSISGPIWRLHEINRPSNCALNDNILAAKVLSLNKRYWNLVKWPFIPYCRSVFFAEVMSVTSKVGRGSRMVKMKRLHLSMRHAMVSAWIHCTHSRLLCHGWGLEVGAFLISRVFPCLLFLVGLLEGSPDEKWSPGFVREDMWHKMSPVAFQEVESLRDKGFHCDTNWCLPEACNRSSHFEAIPVWLLDWASKVHVLGSLYRSSQILWRHRHLQFC